MSIRNSDWNSDKKVEIPHFVEDCFVVKQMAAEFAAAFIVEIIKNHPEFCGYLLVNQEF